MELTQDDVPICRILFNEGTHAMALAMYGDRAKEIYKFVCEIIGGNFFADIKWCSCFILRSKLISKFFFENNLIDFSVLSENHVKDILHFSPIAGKIWDSSKLDFCLEKIGKWHAKELLVHSRLSKKVWESGKLDSRLGELDGYDILCILTRHQIAEKVWDSGKLDAYLHKLDNYEIEYIFKKSPIKDKIKASGKLSLK